MRRPYLGGAESYAAHRIPYPGPLLDEIVSRSPGTGQLLDLACGPGPLALPLSASFAEVVAVDVEPDMLRVGRAKGALNITWIESAAENFKPDNKFDAITIGNAFHWLDRPLIARRALGWLKPRGILAIPNTASVWQIREPWQQVAVDVIGRYWQADRKEAPPAARVIKEAGFAHMEVMSFPTPYTWTLESFLGYLRSSAVVSPRALGQRAEALEAELRQALSGRTLTETADFGLIVASA